MSSNATDLDVYAKSSSLLLKAKLQARDDARNTTIQPAYNVIKQKDKEEHTKYNVELQNWFEAPEWATNIEDV